MPVGSVRGTLREYRPAGPRVRARRGGWPRWFGRHGCSRCDGVVPV